MSQKSLYIVWMVLLVLLMGCSGAATPTPTASPPTDLPLPTNTVMPIPAATPTLFPTPAVEHLFIADFQTCFDMGGASPDLDNFVLDECIIGENQANKIVQLDYEVPSTWAAFWIRLNGADITDYDTLTFYARGDADEGIPPEFKLELKGANNTTNVFYLSGLGEEWRYYEISLESFRTPTGFSPICSWENMSELVFTFEKDRSGEKAYYHDVKSFL